MKYITAFARLFVGGLFIFSGFIKLNDPVGFSFKLTEYFGRDVLNLEFFQPYALHIALFVVILEVILGIMILLGYKKKFTLWSLLGLIVFFTFLTFYSAYFNKVTDCGCFGDFLKLTPWESFWKDITLLIFIIILFMGQKYITPLLSEKGNRIVTGIAIIACSFFGRHVLNHLPVFDFRAYKIGTNIMEGMSVPANAPRPVFEYTWKFDVNGEEKIIVSDNSNYPVVEGGTYVSMEVETVEEGYEPPIHDFVIEDNEGTDHIEAFMEVDKLVVVITYNLTKSDEDAFPLIKTFTDKAKNKGYQVIGLTASGPDEIEDIKSFYNLDFDFYLSDETALKTILRSNPGIMILEKGVVTQKDHYNDLDDLTL